LKPLAYSYLRMSTDVQLKGDSRRRQLELSRAYAEANGLELAEGAELEDIGVSAFRGANVRDGALGRFLDAVRDGIVKPGSYLLVESLDRLSREEVLSAQALFLTIIRAGIHLVTLIDGQVYRANTTGLKELLYSLVSMSRSHEESQVKSVRLSGAWKNKRSEAVAHKPMTKWCPAWLEISPDRSGYVAIPERVALVQRMFEDSALGIGMFSITRRLNDAKVPTFNNSNGWHQSYIAKILANRAVLGEFQPHMRTGKRRTPQGERIQGYFPAVVAEELFYRVQFMKSQRRDTSAGRKGHSFTNLFSGLAKCHYCKSPMLFENKGGGQKGGTYLVCDGTKRGLGCQALRWRYKDFEASFLAFVEEIDVQSILDERHGAVSQRQIEAELSALLGELASVDDLMEKTYALLAGGGPIDFVTSKLNELARRRAELKAMADTKAAEKDSALHREVRYCQSAGEIRDLINRLRDQSNAELFKLRARIASEFRSLIETLQIASVGERPRLAATIEKAQQSAYGIDRDVIGHMQELAADPRQAQRFFLVGFRSGRVRAVFPDDEDPLRYRQQVLGGGPLGFRALSPEAGQQ
jgi:DNA invertase Pin-like site-specific DNA recombinase